MSEAEVSNPIDIPAIGISVMQQIDERTNITMQCHVPFACRNGELNEALDKVMAAAKRQKAISRLPEARKELAIRQKAYARANEDMLRLDSEASAQEQAWQGQWDAQNRRGGWKPNSTQAAAIAKNKADRSNAEITHKRHKEDIQHVIDEIKELEAVIGEH